MALLSPTCLSRFAGYFFSSFGRELFGAGFAALASPELAQEASRLAPLFFGHAVILAWAGRHDKGSVFSRSQQKTEAIVDFPHPNVIKGADLVSEVLFSDSEGLRNVDNARLLKTCFASFQ